jgi:hypothetical protein
MPLHSGDHLDTHNVHPEMIFSRETKAFAGDWFVALTGFVFGRVQMSPKK